MVKGWGFLAPQVFLKNKNKGEINVKKYTVKVTCEYYEERYAETEEEAIDQCIEDPEYDLSSLQNFDYEIEGVEDDE